MAASAPKDFIALSPYPRCSDRLRGQPVVENLVALSYKGYARRPGDFAPIEQELRHAIGAAAQVQYLKANICRRVLLVEIVTAGN
jgi:hypothetical protein